MEENHSYPSHPVHSIDEEPYEKEHLELQDRLRTKGLARVTRYILRNLCIILVVVLCRLQHHQEENLTSIVYLT